MYMYITLASTGGSHPGTSAFLLQRGDGIDIVVMFNKLASGKRLADIVAKHVDHLLDTGALPWGSQPAL